MLGNGRRKNLATVWGANMNDSPDLTDASEKDLLDAEARHNAKRVASWSPLSRLSYCERVALARRFGENWASILSDEGDQ